MEFDVSNQEAEEDDEASISALGVFEGTKLEEYVWAVLESSYCGSSDKNGVQIIRVTTHRCRLGSSTAGIACAPQPRTPGIRFAPY